MNNKRILLGASHSIIEPLALFHLSTVAKQEGWQTKIVMASEPGYKELDVAIKEFQPSILGFTIYTGNHLHFKDYFKKLRAKDEDIKIIVGGPHATYFPQDAQQYADYVVVSEGFDSLRRILRGEADPGIVHLKKQEPVPLPDREDFYKENPGYRDNPIKNIITHIGCPYSCTYCYNSSRLERISSALTPEQVEEMRPLLGRSQKLVPSANRSVDEVIKEIEDIQRVAPATSMIYFQDDIFGENLPWLREFVKKFNSRLTFHAQVRFEFVNPKNEVCKERAELMREAGCNGLTMAIESENPVIRKEVLNRHMSNELIFEVMEYLHKLGYAARTEQMVGLPRGATTIPTMVNLEADLATLEFNVKLREQTGLPTLAWASTLAPYKGTKIEEFCIRHGFYKGDGSDIPKEGYRVKSALNFPREWVGPSLSLQKDAWLSAEEQEEYKGQLYLLMNYFSTFALMPKGHELARKFLRQKDRSDFGFSTAVRYHLYDYALFQTKK